MMRLTLANTAFELRNQRGPWCRSSLWALGMAVLASGATATEDDAHDLVDRLLTEAGEHTPAREALRAGGLDVSVAGREFTRILDGIAADDRERERELANGPPVTIKGWAGS